MPCYNFRADFRNPRKPSNMFPLPTASSLDNAQPRKNIPKSLDFPSSTQTGEKDEIGRVKVHGRAIPSSYTIDNKGCERSERRFQQKYSIEVAGTMQASKLFRFFNPLLRYRKRAVVFAVPKPFTFLASRRDAAASEPGNVIGRHIGSPLPQAQGGQVRVTPEVHWQKKEKLRIEAYTLFVSR